MKIDFQEKKCKMINMRNISKQIFSIKPTCILFVVSTFYKVYTGNIQVCS